MKYIPSHKIFKFLKSWPKNVHGSVYDFINILLNADEFKDVNFTICKSKYFLSLIPSLFHEKVTSSSKLCK